MAKLLSLGSYDYGIYIVSTFRNCHKSMMNSAAGAANVMGLEGRRPQKCDKLDSDNFDDEAGDETGGSIE